MNTLISRRDADIFRRAVSGKAFKVLAHGNNLTIGRINQIIASIRAKLATLRFTHLGFRPAAVSIKEIRQEASFWLKTIGAVIELGTLQIYMPLNIKGEINVKH